MPKLKSVPVKTADELYPSKPYAAIEEVISEEQKNALKTKLKTFGNTVGFTWLLHGDTNEQEQVGDCDLQIISSNDFTMATDKIAYFKQKCFIDDDKIKHIAAITTGQVSNKKWYLS